MADGRTSPARPGRSRCPLSRREGERSDTGRPGRGVVTESSRAAARTDDLHSAPDLFRPTERNLRTLLPFPSRDAADWN